MPDRSSFSDPRKAIVAELANAEKLWDVLVIGGGASGLGAALEAASRGYKTLLVEQNDFAKGTSSKSTKLIHGGVRYLAQGNVKLVREASIERATLLKNAPHVVHKMQFIVPVYSLWERLKYTIGLKLYDAIAGRQRLGHASFLSRNEVLKQMPSLSPKNLRGGVIYHDGQFDDARLAVNLAQTIQAAGGTVINYARLNAITKDSSGSINGAQIEDVETGLRYSIKTRSIVNAAGVFVDSILQLDKPSAPNTITVSQGIHLVFDVENFSGNKGIMIPKTSDGRVLFALPWHGKLLVGTTDTPVHNITLDPQALESEIDFILTTANAYLKMQLSRSDIKSMFAGLRPLAVPVAANRKTKEISRSHKIIASGSGLFTMLGGKWTTYRKMGEDTINLVEKSLTWPVTKSVTQHIPIQGGTTSLWASSFLENYARENEIAFGDTSFENGWLNKSAGLHEWHIRWLVKHEMARTAEDVLSRRTRCLLLDARMASSIAPRVVRIVGDCLQRSDAAVKQDLEAFITLAAQYLPVSTSSTRSIS